MRRFPVPSVPDSGGQVCPDADTAHHLRDVVRLRRGEAARIYDDAGREADALVDSLDPLVMRVTSAPVIRQSRPALWLVIGTPKGPAMDLIVRMGTELGLTHLVPAITRRSVARPERADRFVRLADAAAQQCGRSDRVVVHEPLPWVEALARVPAEVDRRIAVPGATLRHRAAEAAAVAVGPEGGLDAYEVHQAIETGWTPTGLGAWTLRADTAAVAALALISPA